MTDEKDDKKVEARIVSSTGTGRFLAGTIARVRLVKRNAQGEVISDETHELDDKPETNDGRDR